MQVFWNIYLPALLFAIERPILLQLVGNSFSMLRLLFSQAQYLAFLLSLIYANIDINLFNKPIVDLPPFSLRIGKLDTKRPKKLREKLPNFRSSNLF